MADQATQDMLVHALAMAARGLRVFRLARGSKKPIRDVSWSRTATVDETIATELWTEPFNLGVAGGRGHFMLDVDRKPNRNGQATLDAWEMLGDELPPTLTVSTPNGGRHLYFRGDAGLSVDGLGPGLEIRGDGGYVVGPGSTFEGKRYEIVDDRPIAEAPPWLMRRIAALPKRTERAGDTPLAPLDEPEQVSEAAAWLRDDAPPALQGQAGNHTTYTVAAHLRDMALSEPTACSLLARHYNPRCEPPWSGEEIERITENAYRYGRNAPGSGHPSALFAPISSSALGEANAGFLRKSTEIIPKFVEKIEYRVNTGKRRWLVNSLLVPGSVSLLVAPGGVSKSTFTILASLALASGRGDLIGFPIERPARVWGLNGEDSDNELRLRLKAAMAQGAVAPEELADENGASRLCWSATEDMPDFKLWRKGSAAQCVDALIRETQRLRVELLILDPMVLLHDADENDNAAMAGMLRGTVKRIAAEADCAVWLIHHTRKPAAGVSGGAGNVDDARGAGALRDLVRVAHTLYSMSEADAARFGVDPEDRHRYVRLDDAKANMSLLTGRPRWFRRVSVDVPCVDGVEDVGALERVDLVDRKMAMAGAPAVISDYLALCLDEGGPAGRVRFSAFADKLADSPFWSEKSGRAIAEALRRALAKAGGRVTVDDYTVYTTQEREGRSPVTYLSFEHVHVSPHVHRTEAACSEPESSEHATARGSACSE